MKQSICIKLLKQSAELCQSVIKLTNNPCMTSIELSFKTWRSAKICKSSGPPVPEIVSFMIFCFKIVLYADHFGISLLYKLV